MKKKTKNWLIIASIILSIGILFGSIQLCTGGQKRQVFEVSWLDNSRISNTKRNPGIIEIEYYISRPDETKIISVKWNDLNTESQIIYYNYRLNDINKKLYVIITSNRSQRWLGQEKIKLSFRSN